MVFKKNKIIKNDELRDYFKYEKKNSIDITRLISIILIILVGFNIFNGLMDIRNMENYIASNENSHSVLENSKKEMKKLNEENNYRKINMGNLRKIFDTVGVENLDSLYIERDNVQIIGRASNIKIIEKLMKNKILDNSYVKKIEGKNPYNFEIDSMDQ